MKKSDLFFSIGAGILALAIILVVVFKFLVTPKPKETFDIQDIEQIKVTDFNGDEINLTLFLEKSEVTYMLIFQLNDCYSCVYRGLTDLKALQKEGKQCLALVVHDNMEDVQGWSAHEDFSPFLMLKRTDFLEYVNCPHTPVFLKIAKGKIKSYRYIVAN